MPKEIRVYSMAVLDLLTCALGGTVLVSFLLIVSMGQLAATGFPYDYFTVSGGVWVDVTAATTRIDEGLADRLLTLEPGPVAEAGRNDADQIRALLREYEVELKIFFQPNGAPASPIARGEIADPLLRVNTSRGGGERRDVQRGASFTTATSRVGLRRVNFEDDRRLYAAFRVSAAGFRIQRGWYFIDLSVVKSAVRGVGPKTAAWLQVDCGGQPGATRLLTHSPFDETDEAEWPDGRGYANILKDLDLGVFPPDVVNDPAKIGPEMTKRSAPDLFIPGWPAGYPPTAASAPSVEPAAVPGSPLFEAVIVGPIGNESAPYFALRRRRNGPGDALPPAARFTIPPTDPTKAPGWVRANLQGRDTYDEYLPGFEIREEGRHDKP